jgi:glutaredoxin
LKTNNYEYEYIDVDLLSAEEREEINKEIKKYNERISFPTVVIDDEVVVVGHNSDMLKEALEND